MKRVLPLFLFLVFFSCAPQAAWFHVDVKDTEGQHLNISGKQLAIFSVAPSGDTDSILAGNAALALAAKIEQDRELNSSLPVFSLSDMEFAGLGADEYDADYLKDLMLRTGADFQIFVHSLEFGDYRLGYSANGYGPYGERTVYVPCMAKLGIYDALEDSVVLDATLRDTVYLSVLAEVGKNSFGKVVESKLPQLSKVVGESMGRMISSQWYTQDRTLVNYPGNEKWEKPLAKAMDSKWKESVALWMPLAGNANNRIASYASYNIAVGCEMLGQFAVARKWAEFSVGKFRFQENVQLRDYLQKKK